MPSVVRAHEHAVAIYRDPGELLRSLGAFITQAVARGELVVFVHAYATEAEALDALRSANPRVAPLLERKIVLVSFYQDAFEARRGRIDFDHVVRTIDELLVRAKTEGCSGLAIFVDASRVYLAAHRHDEWFAFEERLGRRLHHAASLVCAYAHESISSPGARERVLLTHLYRFEV